MAARRALNAADCAQTGSRGITAYCGVLRPVQPGTGAVSARSVAGSVEWFYVRGNPARVWPPSRRLPAAHVSRCRLANSAAVRTHRGEQMYLGCTSGGPLMYPRLSDVAASGGSSRPGLSREPGERGTDGRKPGRPDLSPLDGAEQQVRHEDP
jgi:hypothetical protein